MPKQYQEQLVDKKTKELIKNLRVVSIDESDAEMLNGDVKATGIQYVLAEIKPDEKELRAKLFAELEAKEVKMPKNSKTEALQAKLDETNV